MYTNSSPDDNTSVIKMMKGFYRFLDRTPPPARRANLFEDRFAHNKPGLDSSSSSSRVAQSSVVEHDNSRTSFTNPATSFTNPGTSFTNPGTSFTNPRVDKSVNKRKSMLTLSVDEKAELIASKSKAAKLEVQLKTLDSERRRSDIEGDKKRRLMADKFAKDQEEVDVLRRRYKELVEQKQTAVEELAAFEKIHNEMKDNLSKKINDLQRDNLQMKCHLEEIQCGVDDEFDEIREKYKRISMDYAMCKQKLEEAETQLNMGRSRVEETKEMISDYNELSSRCQLAEGKVKHLEQKLLEQEEAYIVVQKSQKQLASYRELEKENKRLREDNTLYSDSASNALILEEKLKSLSPKVAEAKRLKEKVGQLEYENEALLEKLKKWECPVATNTNIKARSPADWTRILGDLQSSQLNLTASNTQWETRALLTDSLLESKQEECYDLLKQFRDVTAQNEQLEDKNQKLRRRLTLLTTERDGLRHVLSSYEQEEGTATQIHMQQAEEKVNQYNQQIKVLEDDLAAAKMEAVRQKTKYLELNQELDKLKSAQKISEENIKVMVEDQKIKKMYEELKEKYEKMNEEKEILELRIEKKEMQGDYDQLKTKVLHLKDNPAQLAHEAYHKNLKETFEENERMRKKIIKLQSVNEELEESMNVSKLIKSSKPMEDALKQVQEWKLKYKRLEEEYGKTAKRLIVAVKNVIGYSIKETQVNTYRIQSIFSENADDFFLFQCSQTKEKTDTGVVQTQFTKQWIKQLDKYVGELDSIPLFLGAVNQELFNRTQ